MTDSANTLEEWREVHQHLSQAIVVAHEAVSVAKAQRRYWLEEISANVSPMGKLEASSVWLKPVATKKSPAKKRAPKEKKKPASSKKRKKSDDTLTDEEEGASPPGNKPLKKRKPAKKRIVLEEPQAEEDSSTNVLRLTLQSSAVRPPTTAVGGAAELGVATGDTSGGAVTEPTIQEQHAPSSMAYDSHYGGHGSQWTTPSAMQAAVAAAANPDNFHMMQHIPEHLRPFLAAAQTAAVGGMTVPHAHQPSSAMSGMTVPHAHQPPSAVSGMNVPHAQPPSSVLPSHFSPALYAAPAPAHYEGAAAESSDDGDE